MARLSRAEGSLIVDFVINTTELDHIRQVRDLLNGLFPIAVTALILIGMIAPGLIILQSAKDAALLRVLGSTKKQTRLILMLEQIILFLGGMVVGIAVLTIYNTRLLMEGGPIIILCFGLYFVGIVTVTMVSSMIVSKKKVMELLQVKE